MAQQSRIAHFKSPFIVTVAAAAAVTACAGPLPEEWRPWQRPTVDVPPTANPPPVPKEFPPCPDNQPGYREACELDPSVECSWGDCLGSPTTWGSCDSDTGTWYVLEVSCNPPAPPPEPPPVNLCPESPPQDGAPCDNPPLSCSWSGSECFGFPTTFGFCDPDTGTWGVATDIELLESDLCEEDEQ